MMIVARLAFLRGIVSGHRAFAVEAIASGR
jgi:hypothetical protein